MVPLHRYRQPIVQPFLQASHTPVILEIISLSYYQIPDFVEFNTLHARLLSFIHGRTRSRRTHRHRENAVEKMPLGADSAYVWGYFQYTSKAPRECVIPGSNKQKIPIWSP